LVPNIMYERILDLDWIGWIADSKSCSISSCVEIRSALDSVRELEGSSDRMVSR